MTTWTKVEPHFRMLRRAFRARGLRADLADRYGITEMRYNTDGYTTLAVVILKRWDTSESRVHGYGIAVRAVGDRHVEQVGANLALRRAFDCAAQVVAHRVAW